MQIAIIVTDFGAAVNVGGSPETKVAVFDLTPEIADYIEANQGQYRTICFGLADSDAKLGG